MYGEKKIAAKFNFSMVALPLSMGFPDFFKEEDSRSLAKNALRLKLKSIWASKNLEIAL